ncbi:hypothetical protein, partial [Paracidovorax avenae]|uniref:hypothetical protein n=1 Tax=Paracidovorax avenae TaxID=80867 RepID=UPI003F52DEAC
EGDQITREEADRRLRAELSSYEAAVGNGRRGRARREMAPGKCMAMSPVLSLWNAQAATRNAGVRGATAPGDARCHAFRA